MTAVEYPIDESDRSEVAPCPLGYPAGRWLIKELHPELSPPSGKDLEIEQRVLRTVSLVGERGYGLTLKKLSKGLIGGPVGIDKVRSAVEGSRKVSFDGTFVCAPGRGSTVKCHARRRSDRKLRRAYMRIARDYAEELSKLCPWVECVLVSGSVASGGIAVGDDLDFDIIAKDGTKFITYLFALALGLKYAIKNRALFKDRYFGFLPKVICVNVVWERRQVLPFERQDEQVAYELMVSKVLYNRPFYSMMIGRNLWLKDYFPQLLKRSEGAPLLIDGKDGKASAKRPRLMNLLASKVLQSMYQVVRLSRKNELDKLHRMEFVEARKRPYGLFDD